MVPSPSDEPLLALTLWQPWAWCIAHGTKRVENRNWPPPESLVGQRFAIHAGRRYDTPGAASLAARSADFGLLAGQPPGESDIVRGALVAIARLVGAVRVARAPSGAFVAKRWLGELGPDLVREVEQSPWTQGVWGWLLDDVVAIPPIPCPGNRKLWTVPPQLAAAARAAGSAARSHRTT